MKPEYIVPIVIGILQLGLLLGTIDTKRAILRLVHSLNMRTAITHAEHATLIIRIINQYKKSEETQEAQDVLSCQSSAEVIKQVTDALEAITLAKNKDVKIIISNDKINQEGFEVKLSYRLDDPV